MGRSRQGAGRDRQEWAGAGRSRQEWAGVGREQAGSRQGAGKSGQERAGVGRSGQGAGRSRQGVGREQAGTGRSGREQAGAGRERAGAGRERLGRECQNPGRGQHPAGFRGWHQHPLRAAAAATTALGTQEPSGQRSEASGQEQAGKANTSNPVCSSSAGESEALMYSWDKPRRTATATATLPRCHAGAPERCVSPGTHTRPLQGDQQPRQGP